MNKTSRFADSPLGDRDWERLDETIVNSVRRQLIGRRFIDIYGPLGQGVQTVTNDVYEEKEHGMMGYHGESLQLTEPTKRINLTVPLLYKDFILYWRDIEQAKTLDIPVDFSAAANAAAQSALLEDDMVFNGAKTFDIDGLMNVKGRLTHIREDWMKSGNAFMDVVEARNKLLKMGHSGPYALVLSPSLYALIHRVHEGTHVLEIEHIRELVTDGIHQSPVIKEDSGVLVATGRENLDLAIAEDFDSAFMDTDNMNYLFRVYESCVLRIKRPSSICTLESPKKK
ncbi:family 1 encapsulin nanocompartment shell protein [Alkalihalobacillus sp. AL-G]|uniref:family 1 encapsulin nanocompartment shell protein n=1 Tax=Alkalihalobacillus sp. AL-G TaxID=2926399 RepID=UPI00272A5AC4|nr:family 1 encapsulin nanocompartment shell protein [Alkalihalobacillus sp. AL-G]WLD91960.1 bacteriocin family protein [Alkalihalobacillus sp. AL-G]